jgi:hypothetical protein
MLHFLINVYWGCLLAPVLIGALLFVRLVIRDLFSQPCSIVVGFRGFIIEGGLRDLLMALGAILAVTLILAPFLPH